LQGIKSKLKPPEPTTGNAYEKSNPASELLKNLPEAIKAINHLPISGFFSEVILQNLAATKAQEFKLFSRMSDHDTLLALIDTA
jgi:glutamine synthetase